MNNIEITVNERCARVSFLFPGRLTNTISPAAMNRLTETLLELEASGEVDVVLFQSGSFSGFSEHGSSLTSTEKHDMEASAHGTAEVRALWKYWLQTPLRTVALIEGNCHGTGLEWVLHCDERWAVAEFSSSLQLFRPGAPFPHWGGATHLIREYSSSAWPLLLGKKVLPRQAATWGVIDHAFSRRRAKIEIEQLLDHGKTKPRQRRSRFLQRVHRFLLPFRGTGPQHELINAALTSPCEGHRLEDKLHRAGPFARDALLDQNDHCFPATVCFVDPFLEHLEPLCRLASSGSHVALVVTTREKFPECQSQLRQQMLQVVAGGALTPLEGDQALQKIKLLAFEDLASSPCYFDWWHWGTNNLHEEVLQAWATLHFSPATIVTWSQSPKYLVGNSRRNLVWELPGVLEIEATTDQSVVNACRNWLDQLGYQVIIQTRESLTAASNASSLRSVATFAP